MPGAPDVPHVPDGGLLDPDASGTWLPTAPLMVEILSPALGPAELAQRIDWP